MAKYMTAEELTRPTWEAVDFELSSGGTIQLCPVSRKNAMAIADAAQKGNFDLYEARVLAYGIASPTLTVKQAEVWRETSKFDELQEIIEAILKVSALTTEGQALGKDGSLEETAI